MIKELTTQEIYVCEGGYLHTYGPCDAACVAVEVVLLVGFIPSLVFLGYLNGLGLPLDTSCCIVMACLTVAAMDVYKDTVGKTVDLSDDTYS